MSCHVPAQVGSWLLLIATCMFLVNAYDGISEIEVLQRCNKLLEADPTDQRALYNRGVALYRLKRYEEALASFQAARTLYPDDGDTALAISHVMTFVDDVALPSESVTSVLNTASTQDYRTFVVQSNHALERGNISLALRSLATALRLNNIDGALAASVASILTRYKRVSKGDNLFARGVYWKAIRAQNQVEALTALTALCSAEDLHRWTIYFSWKNLLSDRDYQQQRVCDLALSAQKGASWDDFTVVLPFLRSALQYDFASKHSRSASPLCPLPLQALALPLSPYETKSVAVAHSLAAIRRAMKSQPNFSWIQPTPGRILEIAYITSETGDRQVGRDLAILLELHNAAAVKLHCFDLVGSKDMTNKDRAWNKKIKRACGGGYYDVSGSTIVDTAFSINEESVDVLISVDGWTVSPFINEVLALRPALLQLSFKGFAGSTGNPAVNGIVGDTIATPPEYASHNTEHLLLHPLGYHFVSHESVYGTSLDALHPNGGHTARIKLDALRKQYDIPPHSFVFASFNNMYKIDSLVYELWMDLLRWTESQNAVLWLLYWDKSRQSATSMRRHAHMNNVDPLRVIFTDFAPTHTHLQVKALADLFLDSFIYGAHGTAADALYAGVPIVTLPGERLCSSKHREMKLKVFAKSTLGVASSIISFWRTYGVMSAAHSVFAHDFQSYIQQARAARLSHQPTSFTPKAVPEGKWISHFELLLKNTFETMLATAEAFHVIIK